MVSDKIELGGGGISSLRRIKNNSNCSASTSLIRYFVILFWLNAFKILNQKIKDAYFSASFVSNPYYELPSGTKEEFITLESGLSSLTLEEIAKKMTEALFAELSFS